MLFHTIGYSLADPGLYLPLDRATDRGEVYRPSHVPPDWTPVERTVWTAWSRPVAELADQGWKIHVSARFDRVGRVLDQVSEACFAGQVPFKHLSCERFLLYTHHKHAPREQAGEFCTIYPTRR